MTSILVRQSTTMGSRTVVLRVDDEVQAREQAAMFQEMGCDVYVTELSGRRTVAEIVKERDKKLARASRKRRGGAVIVDISSRRA